MVIIASGNQQFESVIEALHLGADDYLLEPFGTGMNFMFALTNALKNWNKKKGVWFPTNTCVP